MKTWAWASALAVVAGAGTAVWSLWLRAATYCGADDPNGIACSITTNEATIWSWVAVALGVLGTAALLWLGREA